MLIVMKKDASEAEISRVCQAVEATGLTPHPIPGPTRVAIGVTGNLAPVDPQRLAMLPGVVEIIRVTKPFKLTGRDMKPENTVVRVNGIEVGGDRVVVIAGPCSVESESQTLETARRVKELGADMLRGGAYKPRTSPYSFQGMGSEGLAILESARRETSLPVVSEVVDIESLDLVEQSVDVLQIGARNMQNYSLLRRAGQSDKPVLLKRGLSATLEEFLLAAEYVMSEGNRQVILCERGVRTFCDHTRFTLDLSIVPQIKRMSHLPIIVDPSHAVGRRELVIPMARAAVAAGADGVIVEVHPDPAEALSDGPQALTPSMFAMLMEEIRIISQAVRRSEQVPT